MLCGTQVAGPVKVQYKWLFLSTRAFMPGFPADKFSRFLAGGKERGLLHSCKLPHSLIRGSEPSFVIAGGGR